MSWYDELMSSTKVVEDEQKFRRVLLYGKSGTGKTLFAASAPKPLFVDIDKGLLSLTERGIDVPKITIPPMMRGVYRNMMALIMDATKREGPFAKDGAYADRQTLVIDSVTGLANSQMLWDIMFHEGGRKPTEVKAQFDDYSALRFRLQTLMEALKGVPMNIVVIAEASLDDDEDTGRKLGTVNILGSYRRAIVGAFDYAFFCVAEEVVKDGKRVREYVVRTRPYMYWDAKTRSNDTMPERIVDPDWGKVFNQDQAK